MGIGSKVRPSLSEAFGKMSPAVRNNQNVASLLCLKWSQTILTLPFLQPFDTPTPLPCSLAPLSCPLSRGWGLLALAKPRYSHPDSHRQRLLEGQQAGVSAAKHEQGRTCRLCAGKGWTPSLSSSPNHKCAFYKVYFNLFFCVRGSVFLAKGQISAQLPIHAAQHSKAQQLNSLYSDDSIESFQSVVKIIR